MNEELLDLINNKNSFLTEKEYYSIKNEAKWKEDEAVLFSHIIELTKLNSKNPNFPNTIAYTNFFRKHRDTCFVEGDLQETVRRFKKVIFENENEKELFTREIKDIFYIIRLYKSCINNLKEEKRLVLPTRKGFWKHADDVHHGTRPNGWSNLNIKKRKIINDYIFIYKTKKLRKTDEKIINLLKKINLTEKELVMKSIKWIEYMGLWSTAVGTSAEFYIMDKLEEYVKEIQWRWPTNKEDVSNYDIVGVVNNKTIPIQVKLERSAKIGERGIAVSKVFIIYCKELEKYGKYVVCPEQFGFKPWATLFKTIANELKQ